MKKKAVAQIIKEMQKFRPQVLLTWPSDGLSGHPDHIAISHWTRLAYEEVAKYTQAPTAIYHLAIPHSITNELNLTKLHSIPDEEISLTVDVAEVWEQKLAAIRCHLTQASGSPILAACEGRQRLFLEKEYFKRALANEDDDFLINS
jgi:LmbE family N-acetylglucosaminyl deacetylase